MDGVVDAVLVPGVFPGVVAAVALLLVSPKPTSQGALLLVPYSTVSPNDGPLVPAPVAQYWLPLSTKRSYRRPEDLGVSVVWLPAVVHLAVFVIPPDGAQNRPVKMYSLKCTLYIIYN